MNIPRPATTDLRALSARCEWPLNISEHRGQSVRFRNLIIFFGADHEKVLYPLLRTGRLKLAALPDRLELQRTMADGAVKVIGRTEYDGSGRFSVNRRPAADKKGEVRLPPPGAYRCVSADTLFPVLSRVRRVNNCVGGTARAYVSFGGKDFVMPTDRKAKFGPAACARRITSLVLPDQGRIHFYERLADQNEAPIGWLPLDAPAHGRSNSVLVANHIVDFRLKDITIHRYTVHAKASYRKVTFIFSQDKDNIYYPDLAAGRLFLRAGYDDRIEVVRKIDQREEVLGAIPIEDNCLVIGPGRKIAFDQPGKAVPLVIDKAIEALGGHEATVKPRKSLSAAYVSAYGNLRFYFPMSRGNVHLPRLRAGQMLCRVYRSRFEVGYKESGRFCEIGRVNFGPDGYLLDPRNVLGKQVKQHGEVLQDVDLGKLIPELGRIEKRIKPHVKLFCRGINCYPNLRPRDHYHADLYAGRLVLRAVDRRFELFIDRGTEREFVGLAAVGRQKADLFELFPAFRQSVLEKLALTRLLKEKSHDELSKLWSGGAQANLLKRLSLIGLDHFSGSDSQGLLAVKIFYALASGLERLAAESGLSADLKEDFGREIVELMALAVDKPQLAGVRDSLVSLCRDAYAVFRSLKREGGLQQ
jgi:hypothetical protein